MNLQESGEMYLETILVLSKKQPYVRSLDVAEYMGFSKPSVSRAVGLLRNGGYLDTDDDGHLILTDLGKEIAEKIYERHQVLTDVLVKKRIAADDACKIEHDISDETFKAIKKWVKKNK